MKRTPLSQPTAAPISVPSQDPVLWPLKTLPSLPPFALPTLGPGPTEPPTPPGPTRIPAQREAVCAARFSFEVQVMPSSRSSTGADISFLVNGNWTPKEMLARSVYAGELLQKNVVLPRWPTKMRISAAGKDALGYERIYMIVGGKLVPLLAYSRPQNQSLPINVEDKARARLWVAQGVRGLPQDNTFDVPQPAPATLCGEEWVQPHWREYRQGAAPGEWVPVNPVYFLISIRPLAATRGGTFDASVVFKVGGEWNKEQVLRGRSDDGPMLYEERLPTWPTRLRINVLRGIVGFTNIRLVMGDDSLVLLDSRTAVKDAELEVPAPPASAAAVWAAVMGQHVP